MVEKPQPAAIATSDAHQTVGVVPAGGDRDTRGRSARPVEGRYDGEYAACRCVPSAVGTGSEHQFASSNRRCGRRHTGRRQTAPHLDRRTNRNTSGDGSPHSRKDSARTRRSRNTQSATQRQRLGDRRPLRGLSEWVVRGPPAVHAPRTHSNSHRVPWWQLRVQVVPGELT
jgi:hypothetical protein